ncbi:hypothetical protein LQ757_04870 [Agromyces sp. SYSU K20354]|uniref:hypothetical protein n=1 Tax=Agromyces cavernae TaxID=2898659 RepID=UPI001E62F9BA|nr:hypothetical protein [Agromyces cavernae]MCD2441604.1 hypothetical protein [Agromyces cavernae]
MHLRHATGTLAALLLTVAAALAPAVSANAAPRAESTATALLAHAGPVEEEHCALDLDAAAAAAESGAPAPEPVCFSSIQNVERYLDDLSTADAGSRFAAAASIAVGRIYKDINKGGSSLTFWGSNGCAGATFGFPSLSSSWSTSVSSLTGLNGCWATAYLQTSYTGSRVNCTPYCSSLGSYNDLVKSLVFRPSGTLG